MKRICHLLLCLLVFALCLSICACGKPDTHIKESSYDSPEDSIPVNSVEGSGYGSPEGAILAYAKALKTADISQILSTFAVETYVDNFDIEKYIEYVVTLQFTTIPMENWNDLTNEIGLINRQYQIVQDLRNLCVSVCLGDDYFNEKIYVKLDSSKATEAFLNKLSAEDWEQILARMEYDTDFIYAQEVQTNEFYDKHIPRTAAAHGCDEIVPIAIRITLEGTQYYLCMDVARYGNKWYNLRTPGIMNTILNGTSNNGGIVPID